MASTMMNVLAKDVFELLNAKNEEERRKKTQEMDEHKLHLIAVDKKCDEIIDEIVNDANILNELKLMKKSIDKFKYVLNKAHEILYKEFEIAKENEDWKNVGILIDCVDEIGHRVIQKTP